MLWEMKRLLCLALFLCVSQIFAGTVHPVLSQGIWGERTSRGLAKLHGAEWVQGMTKLKTFNKLDQGAEFSMKDGDAVASGRIQEKGDGFLVSGTVTFAGGSYKFAETLKEGEWIRLPAGAQTLLLRGRFNIPEIVAGLNE